MWKWHPIHIKGIRNTYSKSKHHPPHYPRGHGLIERHVQTMKKIFIKCKGTGESPCLASLSLRAIPLKADMKSPAEVLNSRKYKTILPCKINPPIETRRKQAANQDKGKQYYTRHALSLSELVNKGQHIHTRPNKENLEPSTNHYHFQYPEILLHWSWIRKTSQVKQNTLDEHQNKQDTKIKQTFRRPILQFPITDRYTWATTTEYMLEKINKMEKKHPTTHKV